MDWAPQIARMVLEPLSLEGTGCLANLGLLGPLVFYPHNIFSEVGTETLWVREQAQRGKGIGPGSHCK